MTNVTVGAFSGVGPIRSCNEDHFLVHHTVGNRDPIELRLAPDSPEIAAGGLLCAVADGLGGHASGERASEIALEALWRDYAARIAAPQSLEELGATLRCSVLTADAAVRRAAQGDPAARDMGTTIVGLVVRARDVCAFNAGDSRLYRWRNGFLKQVSLDHSVAAELERAGRLTHKQAEEFEQRNVITNCLGGPPGADTYVDVFTEISLRSGDRFLLCSDGVSGALALADLEAICGQRAEPVAIAQTLVEEAHRRGGEDNATALLVDVA